MSGCGVAHGVAQGNGVAQGRPWGCPGPAHGLWGQLTDRMVGAGMLLKSSDKAGGYDPSSIWKLNFLHQNWKLALADRSPKPSVHRLAECSRTAVPKRCKTNACAIPLRRKAGTTYSCASTTRILLSWCIFRIFRWRNRIAVIMPMTSLELWCAANTSWSLVAALASSALPWQELSVVPKPWQSASSSHHSRKIRRLWA